MKSLFLILLLGLGLLAQSCAQREIYVNGQRLTSETVQALEAQYQLQIQPGRYWYDAVNGWWGYEGQGVAGIMMPGLDLGGSLDPQVSNGRTGVFINGRQVNQMELMQLQQLVGGIAPGRYWVDAYGNAGAEGRMANVNLYQAAQLAQQQYRHGSGQPSSSGSSSFWRSDITDQGYGSNGQDFYIMGDDFSYSNF